MKTQYSIIEDCSPYFIRFKYTGLDNFIDYARSVYNSVDWSNINGWNPNFKHCRLPLDKGYDLIERTPIIENIPLLRDRVSFFVSKPGLYYRAHKDGQYDNISINFSIDILDDKCVTSWYNDEDLNEYKMDPRILGMSRECLDFDKTKFSPLKSMTAKPYECTLFNTGIFHDWDNSNSENSRVILTLRSLYPKTTTFEDARKMLFNR